MKGPTKADAGTLPNSDTGRSSDKDEQEDLFFARHVATNPAMMLAPRPVAAAFCLEVPCDDVVPSYRHKVGAGSAVPEKQRVAAASPVVSPMMQPAGSTVAAALLVADASSAAAAALPFAVHAAWYYNPHTRVRQLLDASLKNLLA